jgi:DNA-binding NarL/FixJ family response regulator
MNHSIYCLNWVTANGNGVFGRREPRRPGWPEIKNARWPKREPFMIALSSRTLRQKLRQAGVSNVPRGPRPSTRENPFGLTSRQRDILTLLAQELTNSEIAARLHLSPKTVDHHVSAILAKLDVRTRSNAAAVAQEYKLVS